MKLLLTLAKLIRHPFRPEDAEATTRYAETVTDQAERSSVRARVSLDRGDWFEGTLYPIPTPRRLPDDER